MLINGVGSDEQKAILEAYKKSVFEQATAAKEALITEGAVKEAMAWSEDDEENMDKIVSAIKNTAGFKKSTIGLMEEGTQLKTHSLMVGANDGTLYRLSINKVVSGKTIRV